MNLHTAQHVAQEIVHNQKSAVIVAGGTVGAGTSTWLNWLPDNVGIIASGIGIILSCVLIFTNLRRDAREHRRFLHDVKNSNGRK